LSFIAGGGLDVKQKNGCMMEVGYPSLILKLSPDIPKDHDLLCIMTMAQSTASTILLPGSTFNWTLIINTLDSEDIKVKVPQQLSRCSAGFLEALIQQRIAITMGSRQLIHKGDQSYKR